MANQPLPRGNDEETVQIVQGCTTIVTTNILIFVLLYFIALFSRQFGILPAMWLIGLTQLVWVIPAMIVFWVRHDFRLMKGILIGAALTFLLNAACFSVLVGQPMYPWPWNLNGQ